MSVDPTFVHANYLEAGLWTSLAAITVLRGQWKPRFILATALLLFGISDIVEAHTGAWYDPWWLLAWKAACVATFLTLGIFFKRRRLRAKLSTCSR